MKSVNAIVNHSIAQSGNCIELRYVDRQLIELNCCDCGMDMSKRTDWEPMLSGMATAQPLRANLCGPLQPNGISSKMDHVIVCYACLDKCAQVDMYEFEKEESCLELVMA